MISLILWFSYEYLKYQFRKLWYCFEKSSTVPTLEYNNGSSSELAETNSDVGEENPKPQLIFDDDDFDEDYPMDPNVQNQIFDIIDALYLEDAETSYEIDGIEVHCFKMDTIYERINELRNI